MPNSLKKPTQSWYDERKRYVPVKSHLPAKKGMVYVEGPNGNTKLIHFGDASMQDYTQHKDKQRRTNYLRRSGGITDKYGNLTANNKNSKNYWSRKILW
jgi:hypothetical protein